MSNWWDDRDRNREHGGLVLGVLLIVLGGLFLASEQFHIDWGHYGWPMFVIVPGAVLLVLGLAVPNEAGLGMAIPGGIITTVGLILAFQESTDTYASWSYAWALVAPGSVGVSLFLYGLLHRRLDLLDAGLRAASVGLGLFVGFGLFFENVIAVDGGSRTTALRDAMPFLAMALGVIIVVLNVLPRPNRGSDRPTPSDTWHDAGASVPPVPQAPQAPQAPQGPAGA
jgi:hypothetical protein